MVLKTHTVFHTETAGIGSAMLKRVRAETRELGIWKTGEAAKKFLWGQQACERLSVVRL